MSATQTINPYWNSRRTFILATTGAAVGLGNIWKFPYIAGENGGGAFVIMYLVCILLLGTPIMIAEVMLGRKGRANPVDSMMKHARAADTSRFWGLIGIMGVAAGAMILMYYSVVAGWSLEYIYLNASSQFIGMEATEVAGQFGVLYENNVQQLMWHSIFLVATLVIVTLGVTRGIGVAVDALMPILFVLLATLFIYSYRHGDFATAANFMFNPDFSKLTGDSLLVAMGHAFFTLSLGMGTVMVYGSYMPQQISIPRAVFIVAFLDTAIALVAGMAIFPLVFASGLEPGSGPGLLFESLPVAFSNMWQGNIFGAAFFVLIAIAALSSAISLIEPGVAWLEQRGISRRIAVPGLGLIIWLGGIASIYSGDVFDTLDYVTSNIMLPLGGLLIAIFVGWVFGYTRTRKEINTSPTLLFNLWFIILRFVAPAGVIAVFLRSIGII